MPTSRDTTSDIESFYQGRRVLVLGGLGFMGQNLVRALACLRSDVRVVDLTGDGNRLLGFPSECRVYYADACQRKLIDHEIHAADIIFNLAGRSGAADSFRHPEKSLKNCSQHLGVLQECRANNPNTVVVFPSSCLVYARAQSLMCEHDRIEPLSLYAAHKYTCEMYSRLYREVYGIPTVVLRISNPIGPHQYRVDGSYGVYNQFIYKAVNDQDITVYGKGGHLRDIISIGDVIQAFLHCASAAPMVDVVNVGRGVGISLCDYAQLVVDTVGSGRVTHVDWPENSPGLASTDLVADNRRIRCLTDWQPNTDLVTTITATAAFYRRVSPVSLRTG